MMSSETWIYACVSQLWLLYGAGGRGSPHQVAAAILTDTSVPSAEPAGIEFFSCRILTYLIQPLLRLKSEVVP